MYKISWIERMSFVSLKTRFLGLKSWRHDLFKTRLWFPVQYELYFEIFYKKLSYNPFIIIIMCNNIWGINFDEMTCHQK